MDSLALGFRTKHEFPPVEQASNPSLKFNQVNDHHPQNNPAIIKLMSTYCLPGHYCMGPVWGKTTDVFSLTAACISVSSTMKSSQHIEYIQILYYLPYELNVLVVLLLLGLH